MFTVMSHHLPTTYRSIYSVFGLEQCWCFSLSLSLFSSYSIFNQLMIYYPSSSPSLSLSLPFQPVHTHSLQPSIYLLCVQSHHDLTPYSFPRTLFSYSFLFLFLFLPSITIIIVIVVIVAVCVSPLIPARSRTRTEPATRPDRGVGVRGRRCRGVGLLLFSVWFSVWVWFSFFPRC